MAENVQIVATSKVDDVLRDFQKIAKQQEKVNKNFEKISKSSKKAGKTTQGGFGGNMASQMKATAAGVLGIATAMKLVVDTLSIANKKSREGFTAIQAKEAFYQDIFQLTGKDTKKARELIGLADQTRMDTGNTVQDVGPLLFSLNSQNMATRENMKFFSQMKNLKIDPTLAAAGFGKSTNIFGAQDVGSKEQFFAKASAASGRAAFSNIEAMMEMLTTTGPEFAGVAEFEEVLAFQRTAADISKNKDTAAEKSKMVGKALRTNKNMLEGFGITRGPNESLGSYLKKIRDKNLSEEQKKKVFGRAAGFFGTMTTDENLKRFEDTLLDTRTQGEEGRAFADQQATYRSVFGGTEAARKEEQRYLVELERYSIKSGPELAKSSIRNKRAVLDELKKGNIAKANLMEKSFEAGENIFDAEGQAQQRAGWSNINPSWSDILAGGNLVTAGPYWVGKDLLKRIAPPVNMDIEKKRNKERKD